MIKIISAAFIYLGWRFGKYLTKELKNTQVHPSRVFDEEDIANAVSELNENNWYPPIFSPGYKEAQSCSNDEITFDESIFKDEKDRDSKFTSFIKRLSDEGCVVEFSGVSGQEHYLKAGELKITGKDFTEVMDKIALLEDEYHGTQK